MGSAETTMIKRVNPELVEPLEKFMKATSGGLNLHDLNATRRTMEEIATRRRRFEPFPAGIVKQDHFVNQQNKKVMVRVYQPANRTGELPGLLWIHGGGYVLGSVERDDVLAAHMARTVDCVVVSVEYRLAPEHPYPAPLEDCYTALKWLADESSKLLVERAKIAIGGASAGGGLAAGLALLARDRGDVDLAFQLLVYPMLDDRNTELPNPTAPDTFVWSRQNNLMGWKAYLGKEYQADNLPVYAAPARAGSLVGLPPAYISVGDLDLFCEENITYAQRLIAAGVSTELHVLPGAYHGFNSFAPKAQISRDFNDARDDILRRALHV